MDQPILGIIAGIIGFLGFVPYILDTLNHKTKPNKATWIIWAFLGIIIAASYYSAGARASAWLPAAYAVGIIIIAALSLRYGENGWTVLDKVCLLGAGAGLGLWAITNDPVFALYLTTIVDAIGALPTIMKAYERPESESRAAWVLFLTADILNLLAISEWTLAMALYPVYVSMLGMVMNALLIIPRKGGKKSAAH
ncbi:MAG: hypothetical protein V1861_05740 [Candidatus Micrarchaeota archaeon]